MSTYSSAAGWNCRSTTLAINLVSAAFVESEPESWIQAASVLALTCKMAPIRGAEGLLQAIADRYRKPFRIDPVIEFPTEQDMVLDAGTEVPEAGSWLRPALREEAEDRAVCVT
ncbi:MAG TPA: hypothetical protein VFA45_18500 [Actinomycetes bacterium]|jgi:hypothetical protein|nr:hypothetical protein [Actinomycetes bacterium]